MASTGPALFPGAATFPNTNVYPGQGDYPLALVQYSTNDVSEISPAWTDATAAVRSFTTSRGRDSELGDVGAGTATIVLDNRARTYDPVNNALIKPLNRWWIREQFTGETQDIFKGYAESYEQGWAGQPNDATTTVSCADEFKVLALQHLPVTDPPRDNYQDVVMFDNPSGYWPITYLEQPTATVAAFAGSPLIAAAQSANQTGDPIVGQDEPMIGYAVFATGSAGSLKTAVLTAGDAGDVAGLSGFALETWLKFSTVPAGTRSLIKGPTAAGAVTYELKLNTSAKLDFVKDAATTVTGSRVLAVDTWYHVIVVLTAAGRLSIYINGVEDAFATGVAAFGSPLDAAQVMTIYDAGANIQMSYDEIAIYRAELTAARIAAHYNAGLRGFPRNQLPRARFNAILDSIGSLTPRSTTTPGADSHNMQGARMKGQPPLDELRDARTADNVDAILFIARDGTIRFLDYDNRNGSPYNTVQATFGDAGGAELPYQDLAVDFSESFLFNDWNVTRTGGSVQSTSDTTSIGKYFKRSQSITDLPVVSDATASAVATALLAKYKDPFTRVTTITLMTNTAAVSEVIFRRDIGDRIRVLRTPPGGGSRIDATVFIQKIDVNAAPTGPWTVTWGVSPL